MAKEKKQRASTYEKPLKIHGTFEDIIKLSVTNPDTPKPKPVKPPKEAVKKKK